MPALTSAQEQRLRDLLTAVTEKTKRAALESQESFLDFLQDRAKDIWSAIKDIVTRIWSEIKRAFS